MAVSNPGEAEKVLATANDLIAAFGNHRRDEYFSYFAPEASFIFHGSDRVFATRAEYEQEWRAWEESGLRFVSCASTDQRVTELGPGVFLFTHRVHTTLEQGGSMEELDERESIVFRLGLDDSCLAVHEHLSPYPS
ncbi:MAG: nuclear transport factor 2 family protein [Actinomycetota bacterium]|nr:nuclear transport factor 2 family protein [Actinomycetota bacterium]